MVKWAEQWLCTCAINLCKFLCVLCKTTTYNDQTLRCLENANDNGLFFFYFNGKISAQRHTTCIQFLDRENNDKNNTLPSGKQICFTIVWGCAEILLISISNLTLCSIFSLEIVWTVRNKLDDFNRRCSRCRRRRFLNSLLTKRRRQRGRGRGKQKI